MPTYSYPHIVDALLDLHQVTDEWAKSFRAKVRHFQRLRILPSSPGKGIKTNYRFDECFFWACCFELAGLGLPPAHVRALLAPWTSLRLQFFALSKPKRGHAEQSFFLVSGDFLSWDFSGDDLMRSGGFYVGLIRADQLAEASARMPRLSLVNLDNLKGRLAKALRHDWSDDAETRRREIDDALSEFADTTDRLYLRFPGRLSLR